MSLSETSFDLTEFNRAFLRVDEACKTSLIYLIDPMVNKNASSEVPVLQNDIKNFMGSMEALNGWRKQHEDIGLDISAVDKQNLYSYVDNLIRDFLEISERYRQLLDTTNAFITVPNEYFQKKMSILYKQLVRMSTISS